MRLTSKAQVTVPKAIRTAIGLKPGDEVEFALKDGRKAVLWKKKAGFEGWVGYAGQAPASKIDARIRAMRGRDRT